MFVNVGQQSVKSHFPADLPRMVLMVPNVEMAEALHRKVAPSQAAYDLIHTHCSIISTIAVGITDRVNALFLKQCTLPQDATERDPAHGGGSIPPRLLNRDLVQVGALLHDIGTYLILKDDGAEGRPLTFQGERYIQHGLEGYRLLIDEGVDESVAQFARNHTGVGLTRRQVEEEHLNLPPDDYVPVNLEQEVVMYADKFHSKRQPPIFVSEATAARRTAKYGPDNLKRWQDLVAKYGVPDLKPLADHYGMEIV